MKYLVYYILLHVGRIPPSVGAVPFSSLLCTEKLDFYRWILATLAILVGLGSKV